jgi:hypothetical protein
MDKNNSNICLLSLIFYWKDNWLLQQQYEVVAVSGEDDPPEKQVAKREQYERSIFNAA